MSVVSDLLIASRAAHDRKRRLTGRTDASGIVTQRPNYPAAEAEIAEALRLRLEADALDPDHLDPAWGLDRKPTHEALVAFFRQYPEIP